MATTEHLSQDEQRLAELGYVQRLSRGWSGFQNFAISFTIISIFAGTFTTFGQAWNYGGPIAISIGWPVICGLILLVAFSMSELASKYPTAGGLYYWASDLGGPSSFVCMARQFIRSRTANGANQTRPSCEFSDVRPYPRCARARRKNRSPTKL